ncbi:hypothetical protein GAB14E_2551 [Colwellia psychrerythraea]|uniref:Uncharacterized protein n=1 Tax=Colwellia psychrerythraea TaxID=28229 RepID=A0A099KTW2_COLPS|nr:hypothetical protein GAB14E_2551 [Colwellia psychrerythraea]
MALLYISYGYQSIGSNPKTKKVQAISDSSDPVRTIILTVNSVVTVAENPVPAIGSALLAPVTDAIVIPSQISMNPNAEP